MKSDNSEEKKRRNLDRMEKLTLKTFCQKKKEVERLGICGFDTKLTNYSYYDFIMVYDKKESTKGVKLEKL